MWVCVGYEPDPQPIIDKHYDQDVDKNWIRLLGFSRIDGSPIFQILNDYAGNFQDLISNVGLTMMNRYGGIRLVKDDFEVEMIPTIDDFSPFKNTMKPKGKQVFSLIDPYGEELWEE